MEHLAELSGDLEKLVKIKASDLSHSYNYLTIALLYKEHGKVGQSVEWAERGLRAFPEEADQRLRKFLADAYVSLVEKMTQSRSCGRFSKRTTPYLENYKILKSLY